MSDIHGHPMHVRIVQEPNSQYRAPLVLEREGVAGTSNDKGKSNAGSSMPSPSSSDDDEAQVNSELLQAWTQRLQVLTVVTAFLASMDGELFSLTTLNTQIGHSMGATTREMVYACLAGALVFHICATILGYVASFALIRYEIVDASGDDTKRLPRRVVPTTVRPLRWLTNRTLLQCPEQLRFLSASRRPSQPAPPPPPLTLLTRCYHTVLCLSAVGFTLAVIGILVYIWAGLRMSVGIFSTICLGIGIGAGVWAIAI